MSLKERTAKYAVASDVRRFSLKERTAKYAVAWDVRRKAVPHEGTLNGNSLDLLFCAGQNAIVIDRSRTESTRWSV